MLRYIIISLLIFFSLDSYSQVFERVVSFDLNQDNVSLGGTIRIKGRYIFNGAPYIKLEYKDLSINTIKYKSFSSSDVYSDMYQAVSKQMAFPFVINTGGYFVEVQVGSKIPKEFIGTISESDTEYVSQKIKVYPISDITLVKEAEDYFKTVDSDTFSDNDFWVQSKTQNIEVISISSNITRIIKQKIEKGISELEKEKELARLKTEKEKARAEKEVSDKKGSATETSESSKSEEKNSEKTKSQNDAASKKGNEKAAGEEESDDDDEEDDEWEQSGKILRSYRKPKPKILYNNNGRSRTDLQNRQTKANNIYNQAIENSNQAQKNLDNWNKTWDNVRDNINAQAERERAERERKARERERLRLIEERKRKAQQEERRKIRAEQQRISNRQSLFWKKVNDISMPLTYPKAKVYSLVVSKTSQQKAVFVPVLLHRMANNKLPYKQDLLKDIQVERNLNYMSLHGLYDSIEALKKEMSRLSDDGYQNYVEISEASRYTYGKPIQESKKPTSTNFWDN